MNEILVTLILAACGDHGYNACMEYYVNCAIERGGEVTKESIIRCEEEYYEGSGGSFEPVYSEDQGSQR